MIAPDDTSDFAAVAGAPHERWAAIVRAERFDLAVHAAAVAEITGIPVAAPVVAPPLTADRFARKLVASLAVAQVGEASRAAIEAAIRVLQAESQRAGGQP